MSFVHILLASHRRAQTRVRGYRALFLTLVLVLAGGTLYPLTMLLTWWSACECGSKMTLALHDARNLAAVVEQFRRIHDWCPASMDEMVARKLLVRPFADPWGRQFAMGCDRDTVLVCSLGQEALAPADDICSDDSAGAWRAAHGVSWTSRRATSRRPDAAHLPDGR